MEQRITTSEQQKWVSKLFGYDYEIMYKPDKDNQAADALSYNYNSPTLHVLFTASTPLWDKIREESRSNLYIQKIGKLARENPGQPYHEKDGLLYNKHRLSFHPSPVSSHNYCKHTMTHLSGDTQVYSEPIKDLYNSFIGLP